MLALLHTSAVHIPVFDALRERDHPSLPVRHLVHAELLAAARAEGLEAVADDVGAVLSQAVGVGVTAFLCTCSTLGGVAEAQGRELGVPVVRVDRPMAAAAVAVPAAEGRALRIAVLAALPETVEPTVALMEDEAVRAVRQVEVTATVVPDAWERFEAGDQDGYLAAVAAAADAVEDTDVIVLAQVSMAAAADRTTASVPVLTSPALGLSAAAEAWRS